MMLNDMSVYVDKNSERYAFTSNKNRAIDLLNAVDEKDIKVVNFRNYDKIIFQTEIGGDTLLSDLVLGLSGEQVLN